MDEGQDKTKRGQLVAMLETLLQRQEEDRKDTVKPKKTFCSVLIVLSLVWIDWRNRPIKTERQHGLSTEPHRNSCRSNVKQCKQLFSNPWSHKMTIFCRYKAIVPTRHNR